MVHKTTVFSADFSKNAKPFCSYDIIYDLPEKAVEFIENSISLAERKKAVLLIVLTEDKLQSEMYLPHGVFLKSMSEILANLILASNDVLFLPFQNSFQFKINFTFNLKSTE